MELTRHDLEVAGCLRRLMRSRFLLRSKNERWFQALLDLREAIESHVRRMALTLEINEALGVAFLKPIDSETEEALSYQVGRRQTLSPLASALIFKLRHQRLQFYLNPGADAAPLTTREEMREFLDSFNSAKVDTVFERAFVKAVDELTSLQILSETATDSGIFEITPLCEILLPLDELKAFEARMRTYFANSRNGDANA